MNKDLNTAKTASPPLLVGADRKDPPEKWALPMVRSGWTFCLVALRLGRDAWARCDLECKEYANPRRRHYIQMEVNSEVF